MAIDKYLMAEMTWPELREVVGEGRIAVMPAGIIEQHGPQLPLNTDIFLRSRSRAAPRRFTRIRWRSCRRLCMATLPITWIFQER